MGDGDEDEEGRYFGGDGGGDGRGGVDSARGKFLFCTSLMRDWMAER